MLDPIDVAVKKDRLLLKLLLLVTVETTTGSLNALLLLLVFKHGLLVNVAESVLKLAFAFTFDNVDVVDVALFK